MVRNQYQLGNCNICVKQKISVINETKWDKILLKPKVYDREKLYWMPWTFVRVTEKVCQTLGHFSWNEQKLMKLSRYLTVFPSIFSNTYLKSFGLLQNLMRNYKILLTLMKFHESNKISQNFIVILLCFHLVLMYFIDFCFRFQCFQKLVLLEQIQNLKVLNLSMAKVKKVNIAVT